VSNHPRTLAIGDIHGCSRALDALLAAVAPTANDVIITLGDYVDRGLDSAGVIDRLIRLASTHQLVALRGNHEEMMLDARRGDAEMMMWCACGGGEVALMSYDPSLDSPTLACVPAAHWDFLDRFCREYHESEAHVFVHGGLEPGLPLAAQQPHVLRWQVFPPAGPHVSGKTVVCGHTPQVSGVPHVLPHAICIDTAACNGGWLTGLDVTSGHYWQANERGQVRESVLPALKRRW